MIYTDENFYLNEYLLEREPVISSGFLFYARQASQTIDHYTFGRLKNVAAVDIPEEVKMCCCELAEAEFRNEKKLQETNGKTSEKIGTYSVNFQSASELEGIFAREQRRIVMKWLANAGLCYRGVEC